MAWTAEMDASLKAGIENGLSASLIGKELGTTRDAVLGRKFRLKLCKPYPERCQPKTGLRKPGRAMGAKHGKDNIFALGRAARAAGLTVAVLELIGNELNFQQENGNG